MLHAIGSLRAVQGVDISPEVGGQVLRVLVRSGQAVKQGDLLLELRHADEDARLASLRADLKLAEISYRRDKAQLAARAISQAVFDATFAKYKKSRAAVAEQQALIAKKRITAPFDGKIGIISVNPGQYLNPAQAVTTLQNTEALFVDFFVPQKDIGELSAGRKIRVTSDAWPGTVFGGKISAMHSAVDAATRNVRVEGRIANPQGKLHPGMFVSLMVETGEKQRYLTVPQTAIAYNAYGATVFIVQKAKNSTSQKPALTAQQEFVRTGPVRGDQVAILSGVKEGDMVVTSGLMKLKNGTPLIIDNRVRPAFDPVPKPQER